MLLKSAITLPFHFKALAAQWGKSRKIVYSAEVPVLLVFYMFKENCS